MGFLLVVSSLSTKLARRLLVYHEILIYDLAELTRWASPAEFTQVLRQTLVITKWFRIQSSLHWRPLPAGSSWRRAELAGLAPTISPAWQLSDAGIRRLCILCLQSLPAIVQIGCRRQIPAFFTVLPSKRASCLFQRAPWKPHAHKLARAIKPAKRYWSQKLLSIRSDR